MRSVFQEELFGPEQYTRLCSFCRGEFPRSIEFFPDGRCNDGMASFCRKCSHLRLKLKSSAKKMVTKFTPEDLLEKTCKECDEVKSLREFYMTSHSQDGKTSSCKNCMDENYNLIQKRKHSHDSQFVYFIHDSKNKRVKISSGSNPYLELEKLQKDTSETLNILASFETGYDESADNIVGTLHTLFQTHQVGNRWFDMVPSLEQYINLVKNGESEKAKLLLSPIEYALNEFYSKTATKRG